MTLEAAHWSTSSLDPAMILLDPTVGIPVRSMFHVFVQFGPDRARVTIVTVRRDTRGGGARHGFGRSKKRLRRRHVALLAQPDVDKGTETINGTIKVAPAATYFNICLVNVPTLSDPALSPPPKAVYQRRGKLGFPITDRLVAELDPPDQEHFEQIQRGLGSLPSDSPEDHERDDVGRVLSAVQDSAAALIESLAGHIPRSSLRSSDLLPFYHQYPAACCGDFLFAFHKRGTGSAGNPEPSDLAVRKPPSRRTRCTAFPVLPLRRIIRRRPAVRPVDLGATDDRTRPPTTEEDRAGRDRCCWACCTGGATENGHKGRAITRIAVAFEAGRDGFWLARWLTGHGIEAHIIHSSSVAVSREHKRAKTDRLDAAMLLRVFLGWLRGERNHCGMVAIPTIEEEDAKRPNRERENLVGDRTRIIDNARSRI